MVTLLVSNPLLPQLDLSCLRLVSSGGSPLPPATVRRAIAAFRCPFFISYGMTECCGKISMSILPKDCSHLRYGQRAWRFDLTAPGYTSCDALPCIAMQCFA